MQWTHEPIDPIPLIGTNSGDLKAALLSPKKILKHSAKKGAVTPVTNKVILLGTALLRPPLIKARSKHVVQRLKPKVLMKNLHPLKRKEVSKLLSEGEGP